MPVAVAMSSMNPGRQLLRVWLNSLGCDCHWTAYTDPRIWGQVVLALWASVSTYKHGGTDNDLNMNTL